MTGRAPHLAVRATVEEHGDKAPRDLYQAFDIFNAEMFNGELGAPLILITATATPNRLGDYAPRDRHGLQSVIRIAPHVLRRGMSVARQVLLHECVHAWAHEVARKPERGYRGHGPVFAAKCNEIGARLGLPEVFVRGRGVDKSRLCNHWPLCVSGEDEKPAAAAVVKLPSADSEARLEKILARHDSDTDPPDVYIDALRTWAALQVRRWDVQDLFDLRTNVLAERADEARAARKAGGS